MKKILAILAILIFVPVSTVRSSSEFESSGNIAGGFIGTAGTSGTYELNPGKLFSSEKDFGKNLYEFIYNRVKFEGTDRAVSAVLANRNISQEDLLAVLPGANITELLAQPNPGTKLTPGNVQARHEEMKQVFEEEKALADFFVEASLDTEPTEIFSNGDESDSGFDLIADMKIIDQILFGKTENVFGGAGPGARPGSNVLDLAEGGGGEDAQREAVAAEEEARRAEARRARVRGGEGAGGGAGAGSAKEPGAGEGSGGNIAVDTSAACPVQTNFHNAVEAFRNSLEGAEGIGGSADGGAAGGSAGGGNAPGAAGRDPNIGAADGERGERGGNEEDGENEGQIVSQPLAPEPAANWSRPRECDGPICIKFEAVYKKESAYLANANCIACHFEKINDAFDKTLDHNLVPSKATGNFLEGPKCKRSMFNLKQNFILIPQPILTPPNDDIIVKGDFLKNLSDFNKRFCPGALLEHIPGADLYTCPKATDPTGNIVRRRAQQSGEKTDQTQELLAIKREVAAKKDEVVAIIKQTELEQSAEIQVSQYRVLMQEMDAINAFFQGFMELYNKLGTNDIDSPCKLLKQKETCS